MRPHTWKDIQKGHKVRNKTTPQQSTCVKINEKGIQLTQHDLKIIKMHPSEPGLIEMNRPIIKMHQNDSECCINTNETESKININRNQSDITKTNANKIKMN